MKDLVQQLRYLGVIPQIGYREYGFRIEDKDRSVRQIILTIEDSLFLRHQLMYQEAPDLCYQKVLLELGNETAESRLAPHMSVSSSDVENYRITHPAAKARTRPGNKRPS